ncbi:GNAT family N-acetyltransferase [Bacillaceae bacterium Marseille-Q3522]|nr:GNAT family N-acetyltransferase [Bacillaceae bacterium Marseille-Q3522]
MNYEFSILKQEQAESIAFNWHYKGEYSFYDMEADEEDLNEFLNPEMRGNSTFAVTKDNELIAFLIVDKVDDATFEIGLGMKPILTGKGMGSEFLMAAIDFVKSEYKPKRITLSVAIFNQRAIKVYRKVGFKDVDTFMQDTNGSTFEFLKMEYEC